jgi:hypothetical protein
MTLRGTILLATATTLLLTGRLLAGPADPTNAPDFLEIGTLLSAHLPGATGASLNAAAVAGLLAQFPGRVSIVDTTAAPATNGLPFQAALLEQTVAYLRVNHISPDLAARIDNAYQLLAASNQLVGTILDLRFTAGDAYTTVDQAVAPLTTKKAPLLVLVNNRTSGAAEVLAAELRSHGALLIGNPTAGLALTSEDYPLSNGQHLRIATTPIKLNGVTLTALNPDIAVPATLDEERDWMARPFGPAPADNAGVIDTNNPALAQEVLDHTSEADLVRQKRKDSDGDENPEPPAKNAPVQFILRDTVLARAVDLVKGLALVTLNHP